MEPDNRGEAVGGDASAGVRLREDAGDPFSPTTNRYSYGRDYGLITKKQKAFYVKMPTMYDQKQSLIYY